MATVNSTPNMLMSAGDGSTVVHTWSLTTANNDGAPVQLTEWADVTWTATGTWGGATLKVQGSADASTFVTTGLSNASGGGEASATADKCFTTIERPNYMRPILTVAGSGASITVTATLRRATPLRT